MKLAEFVNGLCQVQAQALALALALALELVFELACLLTRSLGFLLPSSSFN